MTLYANVYQSKRRSAVPIYAAIPIDGNAACGGMASLRLRCSLEHPREESPDYEVLLSADAANAAAIERLERSLYG